jgi:hypothetical protein
MDNYSNLLAELDHAVVRVGQSTAHVAAQEKRVTMSKQRGDDTQQSEKLLSTLRDCLQLHRTYYDMRLLRLARRSA